MNVLRSLQSLNRTWVAGLATLTLIAASAVSLFSQGAMSPYQDEQDGVSGGGKWMVFRREDKMTAAKKVRFELMANNYLREDPDSKPRVELVCSNLPRNRLLSFVTKPGSDCDSMMAGMIILCSFFFSTFIHVW